MTLLECVAHHEAKVAAGGLPVVVHRAAPPLSIAQWCHLARKYFGDGQMRQGNKCVEMVLTAHYYGNVAEILEG